MEDTAEGGFGVEGGGGAFEFSFGVGTDSDEVLGLQFFDDGPEVGLAGFFDGGEGSGGEFVGGEVGPGVFHPDEGAVVGDEVVGEEVAGVGVFLGKESPEATAGDFGAFAGESDDRSFGVFGFRACRLRL